jgi:hypothetical protein
LAIANGSGVTEAPAVHLTRFFYSAAMQLTCCDLSDIMTKTRNERSVGFIFVLPLAKLPQQTIAPAIDLIVPQRAGVIPTRGKGWSGWTAIGSQ